MDKKSFQHYFDQGYNHVPIVREMMADLDTPLSVYHKLAKAPYSYLFESMQGGEKWGRYSIIGMPCKTIIRITGNTISLFENHQLISEENVDNPLDWIENYQTQYNVPNIEGLPRFIGGIVGYFGYEIIHMIEPKLAQLPTKPDPIGSADIMLMLSEQVVVFDNLRNKLILIVLAEHDGYEQANKALDQLQLLMQSPTDYRNYSPSAQHKTITEEDFTSGFTEEGFKSAVNTAKEYIAAGDVMQVVLSQRLSTPYTAPPLDLYRALRSINPSPYMYYLDMDEFHIVGSSPEILVQLDDGKVTVRPIAGTRKRGETEARDKALEQELLSDPKELAEHLMLIDLGRNDTGRISKTGTVKLTDKMTIERYSHVMHIVSNVEGELNKGLSSMDVLKATFPAGTVSGAPKIRAMEIINELEPVKRGIYSGAIGYLSWNGNMDTAIAIRTAVIQNNTLHIQAGAGVVYDSTPELEWKETMNKGRAIFKAASLAAAGLDSIKPHR
ncbi:MAG: anthranilate synthase component I [Thiotrichaceae bacterium]|nr:anthranilate synthase component I [Thiotrichaceae bacterium]